MLNCRDIVTRASTDEQPAGVGQAHGARGCRSSWARAEALKNWPKFVTDVVKGPRYTWCEN